MCHVRIRDVLASMTAAALAATGGASPPTGELSDAAVRARLAEVEARLARMEREQGDSWLSDARAAEVRSLIRDVVTDADSRASLLQGGATAGWDNGFFLASADGNFRLNFKGQVQFRYVFNSQDDAAADSTRAGFENRRTKLIFTGNVVDPTWVYKVQGNFDKSGGSFILEDAYIAKVLGNGWMVVAGQLKVPMLREFLVDDLQQLPVERSLVDAEFNAGRTQGVAIDYRGDWLHLTAGFTDGHVATGGTNMPALARDTEYSFTVRAEALLNGSWDQFNDMTSWKGDEFGFLLGGALHYQDGEYGTTDDEIEAFQWTLDASADFGGANLFGAVVGRHLESTTIDLDQYGAIVQGGYFVADDCEVFGRFEWGDDDLSEEDLAVITVGVSKYFSRNQVKWSTDVGYALDEVAATWGDGLLGTGGSGAGWRTDPAGADGQLVVRSQLQLTF